MGELMIMPMCYAVGSPVTGIIGIRAMGSLLYEVVPAIADESFYRFPDNYLGCVIPARGGEAWSAIAFFP